MSTEAETVDLSQARSEASSRINRRIDAVLLDMGGVLIDLLGSRGLPFGDYDRKGREALLSCLRASGAGPQLDERTIDGLLFEPWRNGYRRRYEVGYEEPIAPHLERLRQATGAKASARELLEAWTGAYASALPKIDDPAETLRALANSGRRLALCSNVPLPGWIYRSALERHDLAEPFECLLFSSDRGSRKPAPGLLFEALRTLGVPPEHAVMVGDRPTSDIAAGRAAGTWTVWLRRLSHGVSAEEGLEADAVIHRLDELLPLLDNAGA